MRMQARRLPRILPFLLPLVGLVWYIAVLQAARSAAPTISLVVPNEPVPADTPLEVDIWISDADGVGAFELKLEYDRALVEITEVMDGSFFGSVTGCNPGVQRCANYISSLNENSLTSLGAFTYGSGPGSSGDGTLATLQLQPSGARGDVVLRFRDAILLDTHANELSVSSQDAMLTFWAEEQLYLPIVSR